MVSIRYQRQQCEETARRERLLTARRVAAENSIRNARRYEAAKRQQDLAVRHECEARWLETQEKKHLVVQQLLDDGLAKQGQGMRHASVAVEAGRSEAHREAAAWRAEDQLTSARYRLAVAAHHVARHQREQTRADAVMRKRLVKEMEKERTTRVLAAPRGPTYDEVRSRLALSCNDEEQRFVARAHAAGSQQHHNSAGGVVGLVGGGGTRLLVNVPEPEGRFPFHPKDAAEAVELQTREAEAEKHATIKQQREMASRRATDTLREQRRQAALKERETQELLVRRKAIAEEYRGPAVSPAAVMADVASDGAGDVDRPQQRDSAESFHPITYRQRVVQTAREAADEFERLFVRGPPVLLKEEVALPECAPRSFAELLRPARLGDLLSESDGANKDDQQIPTAACVLPCGFQTQPIMVHVKPLNEEPHREEASMPTEEEEEEEKHATSSQMVGAGMDAAVEESPEAVEVRGDTHQSDDNNLHRDQQRGGTPPLHEMQPPSSQNASQSSVSAEQQEHRPSAVDFSALTAPADVSLSSCSFSSSSVVRKNHREASVHDSSSQTSSSSSSTSTPNSSSARGSHELSTTATSSVVSHSRPTMTADQLRIALTRLRQRIRTAQLP